uniref:RING-H2 finger protein ATL70-like n=2 Tax=Nicotiana TaxID=4085 RepID=A0A1S4DGB5_TOBAC|nr:PREDICTED: RING-H2 finger protein ATL70-like [Nicotiana sylvestris]XP_016512304.1 PREDICTED: RING-H2 finger protein ATL70-like [Nicotiana tabacum]
MEGGELSEGTPEELGENRLNYSGYGFIFSVGIIIILIVITYASYLYIRMRSRNNSATTITTVENGMIIIQQGIDEDTIRTYPKLLYAHKVGDTASSSGCSICLADYKDKDMLRLLPNCGHLFHIMCIDPWPRLHPTCPICRNSPLPSPLVEVVPL